MHTNVCLWIYVIDKKENNFMKTEAFCSYLRDVRVSAGVTVSELSKKYGWHRNTIGRYEKDRLCDIEYLYALSKEGNISLDSLLTERLRAGMLNEVEELRSPNFRFSQLLNIQSKNTGDFVRIKIDYSHCEPIIPTGCLVEVTTELPEIKPKQYLVVKDESNKMHACMVMEKDKKLYVLFLKGMPEMVELNSDKVKVIGKVSSILLV